MIPSGINEVVSASRKEKRSMRKRYQKGSLQLQKRGGVWKWLGYWWDGEHRHSRLLGLKSTMSKREAQEALDKPPV
jgi:hypothetical protein